MTTQLQTAKNGTITDEVKYIAETGCEILSRACPLYAVS